MNRPGEIVNTRMFFTVSAAFAVILAFVLAIPGRCSFLVPVFIFSFITGLKILFENLARRGANMNWFITIAVVNALVIVPELGLRIIGFHYESGVVYGNLRPKFVSCFIPDRKLLWKYSSADPGVNLLGFRGREIVTPKPEGVFRILFLGDSCAEQDYADYVESYLNATSGTDVLRFECINLAVAGYSSYQGRIMADIYGAKLEPDLIFACFGWNDHWLAYRTVDENAAANQTGYVINWVCAHSRLMQLGEKISVAVFDSRTGTVLPDLRVPPDRYRENILHIKRVFDRKQAPVVFMTAPTSHYRFGVPDFIIADRLAVDTPSAIRLHRQYNQIVRDAATESAGLLLDLETVFGGVDDVAGLFMDDGIHFSNRGLFYVAQSICAYLVVEKLVPQPAQWNPVTNRPANIAGTPPR